MSKLDHYTLNALQILDYCLKNVPETVTIVPPYIVKVTREKVVRRSNNGRPNTIAPATMTVEIPDEVARKLRAGDTSDDIIAILHIRDAKETLERQASSIVLPGEIK